FSMQAFHQAYLLTNRAQNDGLLFYVLYLYRCAFEPPYRVGYASALAWIFFAVVFALVILAVSSARRWVFYEGDR
ncbi:MAG: ABC transporter permease, partial [Planctomycetota bacterium]